jgi:hypothetical protein
MYAPVDASERLTLLADGSLVLVTHPAVSHLVRGWVPRIPADAPADRHAARIRVRAGSGTGELPVGSPTFEVLGVGAWIDEARERAVLRSRDGALSGRVDLARQRAGIALDVNGDEGTVALHAQCGLTMAAGLLINRQRKLLLHAGGFVTPGGAAWLLVGDSQSGKSSTCANLIRAGWDYLADDQVVVRGDGPDGGLTVEGWPGAFNLDVGFQTGDSRGFRSPTDPARLGGGGWRRSAPLGGLLFPRVEADKPTRLEPIVPAEALGELIRQSPWLLADKRTARPVLRLMTSMASLSARRLRLGFDCYGDPAALSAGLWPVVAG